MDYQYNIRGWLTRMNSHATNQSAGVGNDYFGFELAYNTGAGTYGGDDQFNGNIGAMRWWADNKDASATIKQEQAYGYKYDALNRILAADFRENTGSWQNSSTTFDVSGISYDLNGNIKSLNRFGQGSQIDQLSYGYENSNASNRLAYVNDAQSNTEGFTEHTETTSEYAYDWNGNMTRDDNKRLTFISYNTLNLPETIVKATDTETRTISYAYDATGAKHENRLPNGDKLQYLGKFVYRNGSLEYILNEEGKLNVSGNSGSYQFFVKDHLGNTRLSINADTREVAEINHYYPFGMRMAGGTEDPNQKYLYNGKELQEETDWLDYGARFYAPALARWHSVDPLAEEYYSQSIYHFSGNNPVRFVDANGMFYDEWEYNVETKETTWVSDKGGDQTQHVNVVDNEGAQIGEASVSGSEAYVYNLRDGVMVTNYDAKFDDDTYNSKTNYEYTTEEFQLRSKLMKDEDSPIRTYVVSQEQVGKAFPLTKSEEELHYGYTVSRLKMFGFAIETALGITGGKADFPGVRINQGGKFFNRIVPSLKSAVPLKASSGLKSGLGEKQLRRLYRNAKKEFGGK